MVLLTRQRVPISAPALAFLSFMAVDSPARTSAPFTRTKKGHVRSEPVPESAAHIFPWAVDDIVSHNGQEHMRRVLEPAQAEAATLGAFGVDLIYSSTVQSGFRVVRVSTVTLGCMRTGRDVL